MRSTVIGEEGVQPYKFSSCSADQFRQWMDGGQALCLLNRPNEVRYLSDLDSDEFTQLLC